MKPFHWAILGLSLDIVGAFLLSIEAIKLHNLRKLRKRFLLPIHRATLSPKIKWVKDEPTTESSWTFEVLYTAGHYIAGIAVIGAANFVTGGWVVSRGYDFATWVLEKPWYVGVLFALAVLIFGVIFTLWMLGELVHMSLTWAAKNAVLFFVFIDRKTPTGTIGIIGFALLFVGFVFQGISAYLGATPAIPPH